MTITISLEAAGRELHINIRGVRIAIPVADGVAQRRDVLDLAYAARLSMQDLGALCRHIEGLGVTLDGQATWEMRF